MQGHHPFKRGRLFVAGLSIITCCGQSSAALYTYSGNVTGTAGGSSFGFKQNTPLSMHVEFGDGDSDALGFLDAGPAGIAASAGAGTLTSEPIHSFNTASSNVGARFDDSINIDSPGLTGTSGLLTGTLRLTVIGLTSGTNVYDNYSVSGSLSFAGASKEIYTNDGSVNGSIVLPASNDFTVPIIFGQTYDLTMFANAYAQAAFAPPNFATAGISIGWGGILSITDADGNALQIVSGGHDLPSVQTSLTTSTGTPAAVVTSFSGTDYTVGYDLPPITSIPEPTTAGWALGAATAAFIRRDCRRRNRRGCGR